MVVNLMIMCLLLVGRYVGMEPQASILVIIDIIISMMAVLAGVRFRRILIVRWLMVYQRVHITQHNTIAIIAIIYSLEIHKYIHNTNPHIPTIIHILINKLNLTKINILNRQH